MDKFERWAPCPSLLSSALPECARAPSPRFAIGAEPFTTSGAMVRRRVRQAPALSKLASATNAAARAEACFGRDCKPASTIIPTQAKTIKRLRRRTALAPHSRPSAAELRSGRRLDGRDGGARDDEGRPRTGDATCIGRYECATRHVWTKALPRAQNSSLRPAAIRRSR
jgi:hypothetical protein